MVGLNKSTILQKTSVGPIKAQILHKTSKTHINHDFS